MVEENIIYIKGRRRRAKDAYYCFNGGRYSICCFYLEKVSKLIEYLGLVKVSEHKKMCMECLVIKNIDCFYTNKYQCKECYIEYQDPKNRKNKP